MDEIMKFLATLPEGDRIKAVEDAFADQKRLNQLQALTEKENYTGTVIMRLSSNGRGWRLHETDLDGADSDVRGAIDRFFAEYDPEGDVLGL
jgi:hypothetical protein